ncbi:MAG: hypothetical protein LC776_13315 [Acidobacteria bacterium]|nr:hypothetical protein [Acidobacteriota bacterium]
MDALQAADLNDDMLFVEPSVSSRPWSWLNAFHPLDVQSSSSAIGTSSVNPVCGNETNTSFGDGKYS